MVTIAMAAGESTQEVMSLPSFKSQITSRRSKSSEWSQDDLIFRYSVLTAETNRVRLFNLAYGMSGESRFW